MTILSKYDKIERILKIGVKLGGEITTSLLSLLYYIENFLLKNLFFGLQFF